MGLRCRRLYPPWMRQDANELPAASHVPFATTQWTLLSALADPSDDRRREALNQLVVSTMAPVYSAVRSAGHDREAAEELTQGFFETVVIGRSLFGRADRERGGLRQLIRSALSNYLRDAGRSTRRHERLLASFSVDREERLLSEHTGDSPQSAFDRRWALALLDEALRRCRAHYGAIGLGRYWTIYEMVELDAVRRGGPPLPLLKVAAATGLATGNQVADIVRKVRKRLRLSLEQVIAESVADDPEARDEELAYMKTLLGL